MILALIAALALLLACSTANGRALGFPAASATADSPLALTVTPPGGELVTFVDSAGIGQIAVRVEVPLSPRFPEGAPVVVEVSGWFTKSEGFHRVNDTCQIGAISISYLWPGESDPHYGVASQGENDFAGPNAMAALADVIRFASGALPNVDGLNLDQLIAVTPLFDNVGLFASSHSGVAATNVLAYHGAAIPSVKYLVGRENPTREEFYPLELGYFDDQDQAVPNLFYDEDLYSSTTVTVDYSTVGWWTGDSPHRPYFAAQDGTPLFIVHSEIWPTMWNKRYYSRGLTRALLENGALSPEGWPDDLADVAETEQAWPYRVAVDNYASLQFTAPQLKVMLVFAQEDHVQPAVTKPHIHQAWDGFHGTAQLEWVRLNPDLAYVQSIDPSLGAGFPDNEPNTAPANWHDIGQWAFPATTPKVNREVWQAAVAEMVDRVWTGQWGGDLGEVLFDYHPSQPPVGLLNPHDVDRLPGGTTLITDGGDPSGDLSQVIEVDAAGNVTWSYSSHLNFAHGAERLPNGNTLISDTGNNRVIEVRADGNIVWDSQTVGLSLHYPNDADWLPAGNRLLITERDAHRVIEIARDGTVLWQFGVTGEAGAPPDHLRGPHNADRLPNGNTIIADSHNNRIVEVTHDGAIAWQYMPTGTDRLDWPRDADRLDTGNTLITDSEHARLREVDSAGQLVWQYGGLQLPYDGDRLANGNTLISKSETGHVIEVGPEGMIVWSYPPGLVDVNLPWLEPPHSHLAVRVQAPQAGAARYEAGAPVLIWISGGQECRDFKHGLPAEADDLIIMTFLFPGCTDAATGRASAGTYDWRGRECIRALRNVILYAAGELTDVSGRTIDEVVPVPALHDNIGLIGASNGGNMIVAAPALHGADLAGHLRYLVQWETPVSSQIATRDLGRVWMKPYSAQGEYFNLRYQDYGPFILEVTYDDLAYNEAELFYPVFHDGGGLIFPFGPDGQYTTIPPEAEDSEKPPDPDLDKSGTLELDEDFPLDAYTAEDGIQRVYSRPVTQALSDRQVFAQWPATILGPIRANAFWDIREAVRLYDDALALMPGLEGMVLASVRDHVQSSPEKLHIRQAFEGWQSAGAWVQINPSRSYVIEVDSTVLPSWLPDNDPNVPPTDWAAVKTYCIDEAVSDSVYQLAATWQMADRAQSPLAPELLGLGFTPDGQCILHCSTVPGRLYQLEAKAKLDEPAWQLVDEVRATGRETVLSDPAASGARTRFYRALAVP